MANSPAVKVGFYPVLLVKIVGCKKPGLVRDNHQLTEMLAKTGWVYTVFLFRFNVYGLNKHNPYMIVIKTGVAVANDT
jgi:hypothetical protein